MKTVAAPIYFGLLQSTETTIPTDKRRKKRKQTFKRIFSKRTDVGRTGYHDDSGRPNFGLLRSAKTIIPTPTKKKRKVNLEENLLAGGTDVSRTGHHGDCGRPNLFWSFTKYRNHNTKR